MPPTDQEIADHFRRHGRKRREAEEAWYSRPGSFAVIVARAITSEDAVGKLSRHQWRNGRAALTAARTALLATLPELRRSATFEDLHLRVLGAIGSIEKIGPLTAYDCAQRICLAWKKIKPPELVYLHAGTAEGARLRGVRGATAKKSQFPPAFRRFTSFELEDLLCNYAKYLAGEALPDGPLP